MTPEKLQQGLYPSWAVAEWCSCDGCDLRCPREALRPSSYVDGEWPDAAVCPLCAGDEPGDLGEADEFWVSVGHGLALEKARVRLRTMARVAAQGALEARAASAVVAMIRGGK